MLGVDTEGMDIVIVSEFFNLPNFHPIGVVWERKNENWAGKESHKGNPQGYTGLSLREMLLNKGYDIIEGKGSANTIAMKKGIIQPFVGTAF